MEARKLKTGIIGTVGVPACYGGFETMAHQVVEHLSDELDITVYCSGKTYAKKDRLKTWNGAKLKYIPLKANGIQSIFYDIISMIHAMVFCDVLLVLGVSGCIFLPFIKIFTNKRIIVNIDGQEWKRDKWNPIARWFLRFSERVAIWCADEVVADNGAIRDFVHKSYNREAWLVEYGADHAKKVAIHKGEEYYNETYAFGVCRIEPENNIHMILEAFEQIKGLPLIMVGNWQHSDYGKKLWNKYSKSTNITLLDPIYEPTKLGKLRSNASVYVHGHSAGGTNPSLVEAMYLGLPILAFDVVYNQLTTEQQALYFSSAETLIQQLENTTSQKFDEMGALMKSIADRRYVWKIIAKKYLHIISLENTLAEISELDVA